MYQYKELYTLDFSNVNYFFEFHSIIKEELDFPDYYGCNWSAFWDCLTDMVDDPVHIEVIGLDNIERKFGDDFVNKLIEILKRFKHYGDDDYIANIQIEIVNGESRINII